MTRFAAGPPGEQKVHLFSSASVDQAVFVWSFFGFFLWHRKCFIDMGLVQNLHASLRELKKSWNLGLDSCCTCNSEP